MDHWNNYRSNYKFFKKNGFNIALAILGIYIYIFKIGEAFLGRMSVIFYKEINISNQNLILHFIQKDWDG